MCRGLSVHDALQKQKRSTIVVVRMPRKPLAKAGLGFLDRCCLARIGFGSRAPFFVSLPTKPVDLEIVEVGP
jgi:hypothetical protein